jgi:fructokinase
MILVIGETLLDIFQDPHDASAFKAYPGGAPANVAVMLQALKEKVRFFTVMGKDAKGDTLFKALKSFGLNPETIIQDPNVNTPFALVESHEGHPSFYFYHFNEPLNTYAKHFDESALNDVNCLVGSGVICTHKKAFKFQKKLFKKAKKKKIFLALDFNIRPHLTPDMVKLRNRLLTFTPDLDLLKLSEEDYQYFTPDLSRSPFELFKLKKTAQVIITKGAKGASLYLNDAVIETSGIPVEVVDTTGAGDAFMGAYLHGVLKDPNNLEHHLQDANKKAALSTTSKGAMTALMQFKGQ